MSVFSELNQANNRNGDLLTEISRLQAENAKLRAANPLELEAADEIERLAALAQSVVLKARFEEWAFTRGHRNFTKLEEGYLLSEIQKDWLAFRAGFTAPRSWK
jgi:hypothetical protein